MLGGHGIVELSRRRISPPGLARSCRLEEMVVGGHVHVCTSWFFGLGHKTFPVAVCNLSIRRSYSRSRSSSSLVLAISVL